MTALIVLGELRLLTEDSLPKDKCTTARRTTLGVLCTMIATLTSSDHWIKEASIRNDLKKLGSDVRDASKHRNDYAHGVFALGSRSGTFVRLLLMSGAHRLKPGEEEITVASLKAVASQAEHLWDRAQFARTRCAHFAVGNAADTGIDHRRCDFDWRIHSEQARCKTRSVANQD
jgi:hypothetical protein